MPGAGLVYARAGCNSTFACLKGHLLKKRKMKIVHSSMRRHARFHSPKAASFPVLLADFGCDVTCQACRESSPRTRAIALGSKPPLVTRIARTGLGTRLHQKMENLWRTVTVACKPGVFCGANHDHTLFGTNTVPPSWTLKLTEKKIVSKERSETTTKCRYFCLSVYVVVDTTRPYNYAIS